MGDLTFGDHWCPECETTKVEGTETGFCCPNCEMEFPACDNCGGPDDREDDAAMCSVCIEEFEAANA